MILTAILTAAAVLVAQLGVLAGLYVWLNMQKRSIKRLLQSYIEANLKTDIENLAQTFASKMAITFKATFMGMQSVANKNAAKAERAYIEDEVGQANPMAGLILKSFPALGKHLVKNPELLELAGKAMAGMRKGNNLPSGDNGHSNARNFNKFE